MLSRRHYLIAGALSVGCRTAFAGTATAWSIAARAQQGVPDFQAKFSMGLFLPAGTPEKIVNLLNSAVSEALAEPDVEKQYFLQGFEPKASSPSGLGDYVANEIETYRNVIAEYGIKTQ